MWCGFISWNIFRTSLILRPPPSPLKKPEKVPIRSVRRTSSNVRSALPDNATDLPVNWPLRLFLDEMPTQRMLSHGLTARARADHQTSSAPRHNDAAFGPPGQKYVLDQQSTEETQETAAHKRTVANNKNQQIAVFCYFFNFFFPPQLAELPMEMQAKRAALRKGLMNAPSFPGRGRLTRTLVNCKSGPGNERNPRSVRHVDRNTYYTGH